MATGTPLIWGERMMVELHERCPHSSQLGVSGVGGRGADGAANPPSVKKMYETFFYNSKLQKEVCFSIIQCQKSCNNSENVNS